MGYRDYLSKKQGGGIMDSANPFWNKAYQYVPRNYVGLDVDSRLALIGKKTKTPELPDLSKFREKLDKDLLYGEKDILLKRFNELERRIREEVKTNPYALSNNPTIISYFNELANMYNSPELQSQIDKKKSVVSQENKARESGQVQSFAYDVQAGEYIPVALGKVSEAFVNSQGGDNRLISTVFGDMTNSGYKNTTFGNVGKGTEEDFAKNMNKIFEQVKTDSEKKGGSSESIRYLNSFGQEVSAEEGEGYISVVSGGSKGWRTNIQNLKLLSEFMQKRRGQLSDIIGENAQEGFNQLVAKTLHGASALVQFGNVLNMQEKISNTAKETAKNNGKDSPKTTYDDIKKYEDLIKNDDNLKQALSKVSSQDLLYHLKALQSSKGELAKKTIIQNNPVLSYLFTLNEEDSNSKLEAVTKLLELNKRAVEDATMLGNTQFNQIVHKTYNTEEEYFHRQSLHGDGAYGGAAKKRKQDELASDYSRATEGIIIEDEAETRHASLEEAANLLMRSNKNLTKEQAMEIVMREAAINDYIANAPNKELAEAVADLMFADKSNEQVALNNLVNKINTHNSNDKEVKNQLTTNDVMKQAMQEINGKIKEYKENPQKAQGAVVVKVQNVNKTTKVDNEIGKLYAGEDNDNYIPASSIEATTLSVNGIRVPKEARQYVSVKNGGDQATVTQINLRSAGTKQNVSDIQRTMIIDKTILDSKDPKVQEFLKQIGIDKNSTAKTVKDPQFNNGKLTDKGSGGDINVFVVRGNSSIVADVTKFNSNPELKQGNRADRSRVKTYSVNSGQPINDGPAFGSYIEKADLLGKLPTWEK